MGETPVSDLLSDKQLLELYQKLEMNIRSRGGTDEHIELLFQPQSDSAFGRFADQIIALKPRRLKNFADLIAAGSYDFLWGKAHDPENIPGQKFHPMQDHEVEYLEVHDVPQTTLCTTGLQVYSHFSSKMASLSELLYFGARKPNVQLRQDVVVLWLDESGHRLWYGRLMSVGKRGIRRRQLGIGTMVAHQRVDPKWNILLKGEPKLF